MKQTFSKGVFLPFLLVFLLAGCNPAAKQQQPVNQGTGYSNTKISWGFVKSKNGQVPTVPGEWMDLLGRFDGYYVGNAAEKKLFLTFDEGYENGYTAQILNVLQKTGTPAAFFVTGPYLEGQRELIKRMVDEGHIVGNHTVNHPSMPEVKSDEALLKELSELNEAFNQQTGQNMTFLRPPKGEFSERTLALSKKAGYKTIFWSNAYVDWDVKNQKGTANAIQQTTSQFHNGGIILLHAVSPDNANALEQIISMAKDAGYTFCSLNDL